MFNEKLRRKDEILEYLKLAFEDNITYDNVNDVVGFIENDENGVFELEENNQPELNENLDALSLYDSEDKEEKDDENYTLKT